MEKKQNPVNILGDISDGIRKEAARQEDERKKWEETFGEPNLFIPDSDEEMREKGFGIGFWILSDLNYILSVPRMANGYHPKGAIRYDKSLIEMLYDLIHPK
jgi:hypothetical protein